MIRLVFVILNADGVEVVRFSDVTELSADATPEDALREMEASFKRAEREVRRVDGTAHISMYHGGYECHSVEYFSPDVIDALWHFCAAFAANLAKRK